ncbi:MAG: hypothetical protein Faunusvirus20_9 [Faunusvirus sp.]|jgi:cytochrome b involved in lipid metabolism|uniref:Cytochrome b5 heme-binding domain-containing protein n=1 Tax=Faunusvirus sp. TaxID=2487766 RepID=A0A3G4ZXA5_9VIRU|nr:MAG: hypothetical protein Faunusvirus20_9 [Faunusvirus sp.]
MTTYTKEQVRTHNKRSDCWVIFNDIILDITQYISHHPGGEMAILQFAGTDITDNFERMSHSDKAYELAMTYKIGILKN